MVVKNEMVILITEELKWMCADLGVDNGVLRLETKYYDCKVPVVHDSRISGYQIGGIVTGCLDDSIDELLQSVPEDCVKILFSRDDSLLDKCIDKGFELVSPDENGRVLEALKCRIWTPFEPELVSFESLLEKMEQTRNGSMSASERRAMAESVALQFCNLLDDED